MNSGGDCVFPLVGVVVLIGDKSQNCRLLLPIGDESMGVVVSAGGVAGGDDFNIDEGTVLTMLGIVSTM